MNAHSFVHVNTIILQSKFEYKTNLIKLDEL